MADEIQTDLSSGTVQSKNEPGTWQPRAYQYTPLKSISFHWPVILTQPSLDAIRQIVREEVRPASPPRDTLAQEILDLLNGAYGEMEHLRDDRALSLLQDFVEEVKGLCEQRVQGATQPL